MNIENMKKDIDELMRELFNGTTILALTKHADDKTLENLAEAMKSVSTFDSQYAKEFQEGFYPLLFKYLEGSNDDAFIRKIYRQIIMARNYGIIVNNADAMATLKIEKMYAERTSRELEGHNAILSEELSAYKQFVALQGKTFTAIK